MKQKEYWHELLPLLRLFVHERKWCFEYYLHFLNVSAPTMGSWLVGARQPDGLTLLKLRHTLNELGYSTAKLDELDPLHQYAGRLLVFEVLKPQQVASEVYKLGEQTQSLYLILRGEQRPIRMAKLAELIAKYGTALQNAVREFTASEQADVERLNSLGRPPQYSHRKRCLPPTWGRPC